MYTGDTQREVNHPYGDITLQLPKLALISKYKPMAMIALFLTANRGLDNCGNNDCMILGWKLIKSPVKHTKLL